MLSEVVRNARRALGWTQRQLADEIGVTVGFVSQMESGYSKIPKGIIARLPPSIRDPLIDARAEELNRELDELYRMRSG